MIRPTGIPLRGVKIFNDEPYYDGLDNRILLHFKYKRRIFRIADASWGPLSLLHPHYGFCNFHGWRWDEPHTELEEEALVLAKAILRLCNIQ